LHGHAPALARSHAHRSAADKNKASRGKNKASHSKSKAVCDEKARHAAKNTKPIIRHKTARNAFFSKKSHILLFLVEKYISSRYTNNITQLKNFSQL